MLVVLGFGCEKKLILCASCSHKVPFHETSQLKFGEYFFSSRVIIPPPLSTKCNQNNSFTNAHVEFIKTN